MRVAIFASRGIRLPDLGPLLPENTSEILVGGPEGIARTVQERFPAQEIPVQELLPDREAYGRKARMIRDAQLIDSAEYVLVLWDGRSRDVRRLLRHCSRPGIPFCILRMDTAKPR